LLLAIPLPLIPLPTRIPSMSLIRPSSFKQLNGSVARRTLATVADPAPAPRVRPAFGAIRNDWRRSEIQSIFDAPLMETIYRAVSFAHPLCLEKHGVHGVGGLCGLGQGLASEQQIAGITATGCNARAEAPIIQLEEPS